MSYMYLAYLGMLLQICFIYLEQQKKYVPAVIQKGAASLVFVLIGFLGLSVATIPTFAKVVVAGLIFGLIGDVCLNLRFVLEKAGKKIFLLFLAMLPVLISKMAPVSPAASAASRAAR